MITVLGRQKWLGLHTLKTLLKNVKNIEQKAIPTPSFGFLCIAWLSWNSLSVEQAHFKLGSAYLCLPSIEIKGVHYHQTCYTPM